MDYSILKEKYTLDDLLNIITILRSENGCPWDKVQTHDSIKKCMIEEVYEAIDALDSKNDTMFANELGDVLLQVAFHAKMAEERNAFNFDTILNEVCTKLVTRHTHVFGNDTAGDSSAALRTWEKNKKKEKQLETIFDVLNDVPHHLPALMRAEKVVKKAEALGAYNKTEDELLSECGELIKKLQNKENISIQNEYKKLLFSITALGKKYNLTPETELLSEISDFIYSNSKE